MYYPYLDTHCALQSHCCVLASPALHFPLPNRTPCLIDAVIVPTFQPTGNATGIAIDPSGPSGFLALSVLTCKEQSAKCGWD